MPTSYESFIIYITYLAFTTILLGETDPFSE